MDKSVLEKFINYKSNWFTKKELLDYQIVTSVTRDMFRSRTTFKNVETFLKEIKEASTEFNGSFGIISYRIKQYNTLYGDGYGYGHLVFVEQEQDLYAVLHKFAGSSLRTGQLLVEHYFVAKEDPFVRKVTTEVRSQWHQRNSNWAKTNYDHQRYENYFVKYNKELSELFIF